MVQLFIKLLKPGSTVPEMTIVELQGDLETKSQSATLNGKFIGDLHFTKTDQPVLIVGHHILFGKVVRLDKPMAVVVRANIDVEPNTDDVSPISSRIDESRTDENGYLSTDNRISGSASNDAHYLVTAVIRNKIIFKTRPRPIISNVPKRV